VLDARAHGRYLSFPYFFSRTKLISYLRYLGAVPEPRPELSSGHIPNSFSLPFNLFLQKQGTPDGEYTTFLPEQELRAALDNVVGAQYAEKIISGERPVVTSCGSGMTAGVLWLGLSLLGAKNIGLYDEVSFNACVALRLHSL
jgi:thiosulfate/3-mercaptopyruvate sulfurtransferase